jgi:mycofactocin precursor
MDTAIENGPTDAAATDPLERAEAADDLVEEELLVEEVSIDGMCGVY